MKKIMKLAAMLLSVMAIAASTSCAKDENTGSTNNGSSDGSDEVIDVKYTMGYYHPAKKIKKVDDVFEFSWDGDDLKSITYKSPFLTHSVIYECHYSKNGYITSWTKHEEGDEDVVENVTYEANSIYTNLGMTSYGPITYNKHTFDNNGVLIKDGSTLVTMQNGNVIKYGTKNIVYDNHPNPLFNIWPPIGINDYLSPFGGNSSEDFDISFFSKNNGLVSSLADTTSDYYWYIEYDHDGWPTAWHSSNGATRYTIEYYN